MLAKVGIYIIIISQFLSNLLLTVESRNQDYTALSGISITH